MPSIKCKQFDCILVIFVLKIYGKSTQMKLLSLWDFQTMGSVLR
ncbi:Uncharacterised protein [Legionella gratiana]|uniref:Uncharacterized protein n=1 Tax=Legionella gratiana TaxID=45066 RepID=A0A378J3K5_9GAMM|nr:Uncharacterised protein [Legionella gratiana]